MTDDVVSRRSWRSTSRWLLLVTFSLASAAIASIWFDDTFPIVSLELDMDRREALDRTREVAEASGWKTAGFRSVASFGQIDREVQTYIETEAGGAEAWEEVVESGDYQPFLWTVRQFREQTTREVSVRFTPAGAPYGFELKLPEDEEGASLEEEPARELAEASAVSAWGVDLGAWTLVESSQEVQPGGRTDHTFVYQAVENDFGEARYRLRLVVKGAMLAGVERYVEVPESFSRRYEEMRSANTLIAFLSQIAAGVLYFLLGCGVGVFLLMRQGWLSWGKAMLWAAVVALLMFGSQLNSLPLSWMAYETAVGAGSFRMQEVITALLAFVTILLYVGLAFAAGESLTRRAFPEQVQLWRSWSRGVANSRTVLGLTLGGYVFAGFFVAYVVAFYLLATRVFGWTLSADALTDPNALATPLPWITAVATSLFAGFSEEALFRAVPLAGAALIGSRYGGRARWIGAALVVQALIFAAGHANYPQQPAYARVVELFLPAVALGVVYVKFGLLPGVVAHYLYDLAWFSLPLFATPPLAALPTKTIIVLAALTPLAVVIAARVRWGAREAPIAGSLNGQWVPEVEIAPASGKGAPRAAAEAARSGDRSEAAPPSRGREPGSQAAGPEPAAPLLRPASLAALALTGLLLWAATADFSPEGPRMELRGAEARQLAVTALEERGVDVSSWRALPRVAGSPGRPHRFVWQEAGEEAYRALQGRFLAAPRWEVRFARFEGTQEERAEEWRVMVDADGRVNRIVHTVPEDRAGPSLSMPAARALALDALQERFGYRAVELDEVSAEESRRPARGDWLFTFQAPSPVSLPAGETRVQVEIAGSEVVDVRSLVHVPEDWDRAYRAEQSLENVYRMPAVAVLGLLALAAVGLGITRWARASFPARLFLWTIGGFGGWVLLQLGNGWVSTAANFQTSEPYANQVFIALVGSAFGALLGGAALGILAGLAHVRGWGGSAVADRPVPIGLAIGVLLAGLASAGASLGPQEGPSWPGYGALENLLPSLNVLLSAVLAVFTMGIAALLVVRALRHLEAGAWGRRGAWAAALLLGLALAFSRIELPLWTAIARGLVIGAVIYAVYALVRRAGLAVVPALVAGMLALGSLRDAVVNAFPGARAAYLLAAVLVVVAGALWSTRLAKSEAG